MFNCIIMGAAGRDFHNFRTFFLSHPEFGVCAFTATQIPYIDERSFPRELAGEAYDSDIPIHEEGELEQLIEAHGAEFVFFSYSDIAHEHVMHTAARVQAAGASFVMLGPQHTQLVSRRKVIAITATRTGAGKSPLTQFLARGLTRAGYRVVAVRHPMPYGNLREQAVQRFATQADLDAHHCTLEEREEYEPYVRLGLVIYAGVDYAGILAAAEAEADVILWDGGNNDFSFIKPDLNIVVCDALRAGHGQTYYPGETNFRAADILVLSKVAQAAPDGLQTILELKAALNPAAATIQGDLEVTVPEPEELTGARVLIVEDGPTVTHGGMPYGAGWVAARQCHVAEIVDPRPHAVGSIAETFAANPHLQQVLPAIGYSEAQRDELRQTIEACGAEIVINASPADISPLLRPGTRVVPVGYRWVQWSGPDLLHEVKEQLA